MASTNDLKNGLVLNLDGDLWTVVEFQHVKPGKGGAFVRTTLKNVLSGKVVDRTFNAGTKVETATVDKRTMQYLYADGDDFVFMDLSTYDQITVPGGVVGEASKFLLPEAEVTVATHEEVPLYVELPTSVVLEITYTEPGLQGDRSTGGTKPARPSTCRCSSRTARRSRSTPATAVTWAGRDQSGIGPQRRHRHERLDRWLVPGR
jgi:elongation factor P